MAQWSSYLGFIYAVTGAAVGLGNIWKFPYMAGMYGGSAFVVLYIIFVFLIGLPIMLAEMAIGRSGCASPLSAFQFFHDRYGHSARWKWLGVWGLLILLMILAFYSVVAGWSIGYMYFMLADDFFMIGVEGVTLKWQDFMASPWTLLLLDASFLFLTLWVVTLGVQHGIERASKSLMPILLALLIVLSIYGAMQSGFNQAVNFLFAFRWADVNATVVLAALGHAFFSLAIGAGVMIVYASYLPKQFALGPSVLIITAINLLVAILAGLAIFPLVFSYQMTPQSGPGLMYEVLPVVFGQMSFGRGVGFGFFLLLLLAAWTSSISLAEPLVTWLKETFALGRLQASMVVGISAFLLSIGCVFSFNIWADVKLISNWNYFETLTLLATDWMLPTGALGFACFSGWILKPKTTMEALSFPRAWMFYIWLYLTRLVVPIGIIVVIISNLLM